MIALFIVIFCIYLLYVHSQYTILLICGNVHYYMYKCAYIVFLACGPGADAGQIHRGHV